MINNNYVEATNSLVNVFGEYCMDMGRFGEKILTATKFNKSFFRNYIDLISYTTVIFDHYILHCLNKNKNFGIIEYLEDSIKNNRLLFNSIEKECKFDVIEDKVIIKESKKLPIDCIYEIIGIVHFDDYSFTLTYGGYYFIENLSDKNEQYFYYGD